MSISYMYMYLVHCNDLHPDKSCLLVTVGLITTLVHICSIVSSVPWWSFIRVMGLSLFVNYFVLQRSMLLPLCSLMR